MEKVLNLPKFPLTGIFVDKPTDETVYDQALLFCERCGHGQLETVLDPKEIYNGTYSHRSSDSSISVNGNSRFAQFIKEQTENKRFKNALDVGCSDGFLMKLLNADNVKGIDAATEGTFVEDSDLGNPDLLVSSHTFEHLEDPKAQLKRMVEAATEDTWFFITVPCLDSMIINTRWDQVFHQHLHYFSKASLNRMIQSAGCAVVEWGYDYEYWGGTIMVAFRKTGSTVEIIPPKTASIQESIKRFFYQIATFETNITTLYNNKELIVGFGMAQMAPILNYYCKLFEKLECVFDDKRENVYWPGKSPLCMKTPDSLDEANVVIMAPDSARPLIKRAVELKAKRILNPFQVM